MGYLGAQPAPKATQLDDNVVETADIQDDAVTSPKLASGAAVSNIGYTPVSTGKAIAMSIVFGG